MRLQISQIQIVNWKCYGNQTIKLHQDQTRNISVIFGSNGFGKTSILEAIRWCLYGSFALKPSDLVSRFSRVAVAQNPTVTLSVNLSLTDGARVYEVSRAARRVVRSSSVVAEPSEPIFIENGEVKTNALARIDALLPFACSEFYFFDGVEIKRYAQNVHSSEMRLAIERILGIPELRNLRADAQKALTSIEAELKAVQASQPELAAVGREIDVKQDEKAVLEEQIAIALSEHAASQELLQQLHAEASKQEALRSQLEDLERKRREADRLKREVDDVQLAIDQAQRQIPISLLGGFIREVSSDVQRKAIASARRSGLKGQLRAVLDSGICICGRPLDKHATEHLEHDLKGTTETSGLRQAILDESIRSQVELLNLYKGPNFTELLSKQDRLVIDLDGLLEEIKALGGSDNLPSLSAAELWKKVGEAEANVTARRDQVASLRLDSETLDSQINGLRRNRENLATRSAETAVIGAQAILARKLQEAAADLITWRIDESRETIESETSRIHSAVTNKPGEYRGVEISPIDYSIKLRSASGLSIDPDTLSAGEKEALAFSFIAGLNLASGKSAPFVMDTPFGHLDSSHQRNLIAALPNLPSQVTLLATDRDLPIALMGDLAEHIADTLIISRVGNTDDASIIGE